MVNVDVIPTVHYVGREELEFHNVKFCLLLNALCFAFVLGGHLVSSETHGVDIYINVCRDIKFGPEIPDNSCSDKGKTSPACRKDIGKPIGKITSNSKLYYQGDSIKLVYSYTGTAATKKLCPKGVYTNITFMCQKQFSDVSIPK